MSAENIFESLSDEVKAKLKDCRTDEEMKRVLADADIALDADILEAVSGGEDSQSRLTCRTYDTVKCPLHARTCPPVRI